MLYREYLRRKVRRRRLVLGCTGAALALVSLALLLNSEYSPDLYWARAGVAEDVSCHYRRAGDALPALDERFSPPSNSIFFHETSCGARLDSRQACAVESAARAHPHWQVHVLFSAPLSALALADVNMQLLEMLNNVSFRRVHLLDYVKGTPVEALVAGGALNRTRWPVSHASDVLRFVSLYKWGGVYLDLDVVVLRPLAPLGRSWVARENDAFLGSAALALHRDHLGTFVADAILRELAQSFRGDVWGHNGPLLLTRALRRLCAADVAHMSAATCLGLQVHAPEAVFGGAPDDAAALLSAPAASAAPPAAFMVHAWHQQTGALAVQPGSAYAQLARRYCPLVYDTYRARFGT